MLPQTLTWNVRDISIIGHIRQAQIDRAAAEFARSPATDARVIVMHHNPVKGELSQRHGLKHTPKVLGAFAEIGVDLVLCGHDHQEAIHFVEHTRKGTVISTAGTVSQSLAWGPAVLRERHHARRRTASRSRRWSGRARPGASCRGPTRCFAR